MSRSFNGQERGREEDEEDFEKEEGEASIADQPQLGTPSDPDRDLIDWIARDGCIWIAILSNRSDHWLHSLSLKEEGLGGNLGRAMRVPETRSRTGPASHPVLVNRY